MLNLKLKEKEKNYLKMTAKNFYTLQENKRIKIEILRFNYQWKEIEE